MKHHVSKRCSEKQRVSVESVLVSEIFNQSRAVAGESRAECEGLAVCRAVKILSRIFLKDSVNLHLLQSGYTPFMSMIDCQELFPWC